LRPTPYKQRPNLMSPTMLSKEKGAFRLNYSPYTYLFKVSVNGPK
jgi:hypothetical protein